jgi:PAS domain S-box-containing protein
MTDERDRTREQLAEELEDLRRRVNELAWAEDELKRMNEAFKNGVEALNVVLMNSQDILAILRPDGTMGYISPSVEKITGYRIEELSEANAFDFIHADDREDLLQAFLAGLQASGLTLKEEFRYRHADGSWRILEAQGINLTDNLAVSGMVVSARDITGRKAIEQALAERERYLRTLIGNTMDVIIILDGKGELTFISSSLESVLGYEPDEFIGHDPAEFFEAIHQDDVPRLTAFVADSLRTPGLSETIEFRITRADGSERIIESRANNLLDDPVIHGVISTMRDITERKRAETTIAARERYYRSLIRNAADMVSVLDQDLNFKWGSPSASRITGYSPEDAYGKTILGFIHPDDVEQARKEYDRILQNPGSTLAVQRRFCHKDGTYHWHEAILTNLLHDPSVQGLIVNSRDISERKLIEEQLIASNRELDAFASTVSHDLRSPLSLIEGYAQLMRSEGNTEEEKEAYLKSIIAAARRMDELTESLLEYAQAGQAAGTATLVEPLDVLSDVLFEHSNEIEGMGMEIILGEEFPTIRVDHFKLRQVFTNLVNNAVKYLAGTQRPCIEVAALAGPNEATFYVRDNGPGLNPESVNEIFQPFKRFSTAGQPGLGIGLSTVKKAVESWGGRIWAESEPGKGVTFFFTAPLG